jgi:enoyl-CoA hydratase/carnithine racemase
MSGVGGKAFCAGGDIKRIYDSKVGKEDESIRAKFFAREYLADYALT